MAYRLRIQASHIPADPTPIPGRAGGLFRALSVLMLLLAWPCLEASEPAATRGALTIATYNVENYTSTGRLTPEGYKTDYPKPESAKRALHGVIRQLGADVLALQEIGSTGYLEELRRDLASLGVEYPHGGVLDGEDKARKIAVLSKLPIDKLVPHTPVTFNYLGGKAVSKRGMLEVVLTTQAGKLTLWVVHLKSRYPMGEQDPTSSLFRGAEATALRDIIHERHKAPSEDLFLVAGDFNDLKKSRPVRAFLSRGDKELCKLLSAADSRSETWTHHYATQDSYDRVDHILMSPALHRRVVGRKGGDMHAGEILDIPETTIASDHRPVRVRVRLGAGLEKTSIP